MLTALVTPAVAAIALVAERAGHELFGFELTVLSLTVAHFHFAGFAAALVAGLVATAVPGPWGSAAAVSLPAGTVIVLVGFFLGDAIELVSAVVLTLGMWLVAGLMWVGRRADGRADRTTAALAGVASAVLVVTMVLALTWAVGHVADTPHPSLGWMVATHGVDNAVGFGLCGLLAWRRLVDSGTAHVLTTEAR